MGGRGIESELSALGRIHLSLAPYYRVVDELGDTYRDPDRDNVLAIVSTRAKHFMYVSWFPRAGPATRGRLSVPEEMIRYASEFPHH